MEVFVLSGMDKSVVEHGPRPVFLNKSKYVIFAVGVARMGSINNKQHTATAICPKRFILRKRLRIFLKREEHKNRLQKATTGVRRLYETQSQKCLRTRRKVPGPSCRRNKFWGFRSCVQALCVSLIVIYSAS